MFLDALDTTGPDLSLDSFLETLNSGDHTYSVPDFKGEVRFPENHVFGVPCSILVTLADGEYSASTPVTCNEPFSTGN